MAAGPVLSCDFRSLDLQSPDVNAALLTELFSLTGVTANDLGALWVSSLIDTPIAFFVKTLDPLKQKTTTRLVLEEEWLCL